MQVFHDPFKLMHFMIGKFSYLGLKQQKNVLISPTDLKQVKSKEGEEKEEEGFDPVSSLSVHAYDIFPKRFLLAYEDMRLLLVSQFW